VCWDLGQVGGRTGGDDVQRAANVLLVSSVLTESLDRGAATRSHTSGTAAMVLLTRALVRLASLSVGVVSECQT